MKIVFLGRKVNKADNRALQEVDNMLKVSEVRNIFRICDFKEFMSLPSPSLSHPHYVFLKV